jgi:hypothetical protein
MHHDVELYIDELVLHGFSVHDRYAIAEAVQSELTRYFMEQGLPSSFTQQTDIPSLKTNSFNFQLQSSDVTLGNSIADSVYKSFANGK